MSEWVTKSWDRVTEHEQYIVSVCVNELSQYSLIVFNEPSSGAPPFGGEERLASSRWRSLKE